MISTAIYCNFMETFDHFELKIDARVPPTDGLSFVDYQTDMVKLAKQIARTAQEMVIAIIAVG